MQQFQTRARVRAIMIIGVLVLASSGLAAAQETDTTPSMEALSPA